MSAVDSELKTGRPGVADLGLQPLLWWGSAIAGLVLGLSGLFAYTRNLPSVFLPAGWWAILGAGVFFVSFVALLNQHRVINLRPNRRPRKTQIRLRIGAYYKKGQELYLRLANDSSIAADDTRQLIADEWVNPVTEYLRGTLGESKATYFLSIARGQEPDEESITRFGYEKALARMRIIRRLERLRKIAGEV